MYAHRHLLHCKNPFFSFIFAQSYALHALPPCFLRPSPSLTLSLSFFHLLLFPRSLIYTSFHYLCTRFCCRTMDLHRTPCFDLSLLGNPMSRCTKKDYFFPRIEGKMACIAFVVRVRVLVRIRARIRVLVHVPFPAGTSQFFFMCVFVSSLASFLVFLVFVLNDLILPSPSLPFPFPFPFPSAFISCLFASHLLIIWHLSPIIVNEN